MAAQRKRLKAYATAMDYQLVAIEEEPNGMSGKVSPMKRPGLRRALETIARGDADGLAFVKLDRLSRSVRHVLDLADNAKRRGWDLVSVTENLNTSSAMGRFTLGILALLAELERDQVSERTQAALDELARQGRGRSRFIPFGYRVKGSLKATTLKAGNTRPLVKHAGEQRLLQRMRRLRTKGLGTHRIAKRLNDKRTVNPRTGKPWTRSSVHAILTTADKRAAAH